MLHTDKLSTPYTKGIVEKNIFLSVYMVGA